MTNFSLWLNIKPLYNCLANWLKLTGFNLFVFVIIQVFNIVNRQNLLKNFTKAKLLAPSYPFYVKNVNFLEIEN